MGIVASIIVPVYNSSVYLEKCIRSCEEQDLNKNEFEVIIINDGSTDSSLDVALELSSEFSNIRVFSRDNNGLSATRNFGIEQSRGQYLLFVDSDDWITPMCLHRLCSIMERNTLDILRVCASDVINNTVIRRFSYPDTIVRSGKSILKDRKIQVCVPFSVYSKFFLIKNDLRFLEGVFHEDNEFTPRALYYAQSVSQINEIIYYVYHSPNSITRSINPQKAYDAITVMKSLHRFYESVFFRYKSSISYQIASIFNVCMHDSIYLKEDEIRSINQHIYSNRFLYRHLARAGSLKYYLEWACLCLFPRRPLNVYSRLNSLLGRGQSGNG